MLDVFITSRVRRKIVVVYAKYPDFRTHVRGLAKLIKEFPIFAAILAAQGYILRSFWFVIIEAILGLLAAIWLFIVCRHIDKRLRQ